MLFNGRGAYGWSSAVMKIGFMGLGAMGQAMAMRLLDAGHELVVYNRTKEKTRLFVEKGAKAADTPAALAAQVDLVISMLFDDATTQAACFGEHGIASAMRPGAVHICCSTLSLDQIRLLRDGHAERGQGFLMANVLGRPPAAQAGDLFVLAAGEDTLIRRYEPVFACIGQRLFVVGPDPLQAGLIKLSLNFMIYTTIEQMAEVFVLNEKLGTDPSIVFDIMTNSFFTAPVHRNYGSLMVEQAYDNPGAPMSLGLKDVKMAIDAAAALSTSIPYANIVRDRMDRSIEAGDEARDFVALIEQVRRDNAK